MYNRYITIALRWIWLLILIPVIATGTAIAYLNQQPTTYRATTRLIVGPGINSPNPDLDSLRAGALLMQTYSELTETENFRQQVIDNTGITLNSETLREIVSVRPITDTQVLTVVVDYTDPDTAITIANEISNQLVNLSPSTESNQFLLSRIQSQVDRLENDIINTETRLEDLYNELELESDPGRQTILLQRIADEETNLSEANTTLAGLFDTLQSPFTNQVEIVDSAVAAQKLSSNLPLVVILVFGAGSIISLCVLVLLIFIDSLYINTFALKKNSDYPPLWGKIRFGTGVEKSDMRILSAYLLSQMKDKDISRVMITGVDNSQDSVMIASELAVIISRTGSKVLLVDADFTNSIIAERFNIDSAVSLIDSVTNSAAGLSLKPHSEYPNLYVLPSGEVSSDAFFLIASERLSRILEHFSSKVNYVIVATPSLSAFEDSIAMTNWTHNAIVIARESKTRKRKLDDALTHLSSVDSNILGMIVTTK